MPQAQWLKRIDAFYQELHHCGQHFPEVWAIDLSDWARTIERIAQDMHDGKLKPGELDEAYIRDTHAELSSAARQGWGKDWAKPEKETGLPADNVVAMQQNIWRFSGAKNFAMEVALSEALTRNGKITPWADFKAYALKLNEKYNQNHLEAEYRTARQAGHMAAQWETFERGKDTYPNLKYMTQRDEKVREEHQALQDIIAPVGHDFWDKHYPPNGWRCRCYVVQTAEPATEKIPEELPDVKPQFRVNVGKGGQVFSDGHMDGSAPHPHFALAKSSGGEEYKKRFEFSKQWAPANEVHRSDNGAKVDVSIWADKADLSENLRQSKIIADELALNVSIRHHFEAGALPGYKNPEYFIDGFLADRKSIKGEDGIAWNIDDAKKQLLHPSVNPDKKPYIVAFDFDKIKDVNWEKVKQELNSKITDKRGRSIQSIVITHKGKAYFLTREEIVSRDYTKLPKSQ